MKSQALILSVLLLLLAISSAASGSDNIVNQICSKTPFKDLCLSTLQPITNNNSTSDAKSLAKFISGMVLGNATDTLNYIEGLIKQTKDPREERALANCAELYIPVVKYEIPQAIEALGKGNYGFATYNIADVGKNADACEKSFAGYKSPLGDRNKLVRGLSDIALAIINVLTKGFE